MDADTTSNFVLKHVPELQERAAFLTNKLGNAYKLLADHKALLETQNEVIKLLAEKAGIEIPKGLLEIHKSSAPLAGPAAELEKMTAEQEAEAQAKGELETIQREEAEAHAAQMAREARKAALQRKAAK